MGTPARPTGVTDVASSCLIELNQTADGAATRESPGTDD